MNEKPICLSRQLFHTYIHNWPLRLFRQDENPTFHSPYVECVNFIHVSQKLGLIRLQTIDFCESFHDNLYFFSEFLSEISFNEVTKEIFFVLFKMPDLGLNHSVTSTNPIHCLLTAIISVTENAQLFLKLT